MENVKDLTKEFAEWFNLEETDIVEIFNTLYDDYGFSFSNWSEEELKKKVEEYIKDRR